MSEFSASRQEADRFSQYQVVRGSGGELIGWEGISGGRFILAYASTSRSFVTIEIPGIDDSPAHFTLKKTRPDLQEEVIIIIIADEPLPGIKIGRNASTAPIALSEEQVANWTEEWAADFTRFDLDKGEGLPMKKEERQVATRTRALRSRGVKTQGQQLESDRDSGRD